MVCLFFIKIIYFLVLVQDLFVKIRNVLEVVVLIYYIYVIWVVVMDERGGRMDIEKNGILQDREFVEELLY